MLVSLLAVLATLLCCASVKAQDVVAAGDDEVLTVNTRVTRLPVAVTRTSLPAPKKIRWEVRQDSAKVESFVVDAPADNPLSLTVVLDLGEDRHGDGFTYRLVREELESLPSRLRLKSAPRVFVAGDSSEGLRLKWPAAWPTSYAGNTRSAINAAEDAVESGTGSRRALLIITNRVGELPPHAFEDLDARLADSAAFVCVLTIQRPEVKYGQPGKIIVWSNLTTGEQLYLRGTEHVVASQFDYFTRLAQAMHVISYPLDAAKSAPGQHAVEVKAVAEETGRVYVAQVRKFSVKAEGGR